MRIALAAAGLLLLAACSSTPPAASGPSSEVIDIPAPSSPTATSSAPKTLTWGDRGESSGVEISLGTPTWDTTTTAEAGSVYVAVPTTVVNNTSGNARLSFTGRLGQAEAPWTMGDDVGEFLPGEDGTMSALFRVPKGASGDLVVQVYANVDGGMATQRLNFKGPLPPAV